MTFRNRTTSLYIGYALCIFIFQVNLKKSSWKTAIIIFIKRNHVSIFNW